MTHQSPLFCESLTDALRERGCHSVMVYMAERIERLRAVA